MKRNNLCFMLMIMLIVTSCSLDKERFPVLRGPYPASNYPIETPEVFGPGIISTGLTERDITISPDGREIFYGLSTGRMVTIMYTRYDGRKWLEPVIAPFAADSRFSFFEPCFAPDGKSVYFLTTMPVEGKEIKPGWAYQNIFVSDRADDGTWGAPYDPPGCINDGALQFYPSVTRDRTLYFCRTDPATGKHALFRSPQVDGEYREAIRLPEPVNTDTTKPYNIYVAPDESFMIACIADIKVDYNPDRANYFLFIRNDDGGWSGPVPFGPEINIRGSNASSSSLSPDGRYLFFAAQFTKPLKSDDDDQVPLSRIIRSSSGPQNGNYDIYWTDAGVIRDMTTEFRSISNN
jgi:hypothetical protein